MAASGPLLVSVTVKVIVSPTLGVGSLTVLVSARSACCGVSVALAVLLAVLGSNWSAWRDRRRVGLRVGADDRRLDHQRLRGRRRRPCRRSTDPVARIVGPLARRRRDERQPAGSRSVTWTPVARPGRCCQGDREGDRVADVGRCVADGLGQRQVGLLRRLGGAGGVVGGVGVELVGVGDRRRVGLAVGLVDHGP